MDTIQQNSTNLSEKTLIVKAEKLREAVSVVADIANNAVTQEDRLVNLMVLNDKMLVTATDTSREIQVELKVNSKVNEVMSTQISKISSVLSNEGNNTLEIENEYLILYKENGKVQLPKYKVNHKPFNNNVTDDVLDLQVFYKQLKTLSKHLTKEFDDTGSLFISDGFMYIRNRLFYGLTEVKTKNTYIFDKLTCKILMGICSNGLKHGNKEISLAIVDKNSAVLIRVGNISFKTPMPVHNKINLSKLSIITYNSGYLVNRNSLSRVIKEIREVDGTSELDVIAGNDKVTIKPSTEFSITEYTLTGGPIGDAKLNGLDFTYTVSSKAFEDLINGIQSDHVLLAPTDENMMLILTKENDYGVRYFVSVY